MKRIISFILIVACVTPFLCACSQQPQGVGEAGISAEEFDSLRLGMSNKKVDEIIGGYGELISETKDEYDDYIIYKRLYRYEGEVGGYADLEFTQKVTKGFQTIGGHNPSLDVNLSAKTKYDLN